MGAFLCLKRGDSMPEVYCDRRKCLNNKNRYCIAPVMEYSGKLCQTYTTAQDSMKSNVGLCRREHGKLKRR